MLVVGGQSVSLRWIESSAFLSVSSSSSICAGLTAAMLRVPIAATPMFIILTVAMLVVATSSAGKLFNCTEAKAAGCECGVKASDIVCVDRGFTNVPANLSTDPSTVRALTVRQNRFTDGILAGPIVYVGLTALYLDSDGIRRVVPGVFANLTSLLTLVLANNTLRSLDVGTFDGLSSLTLLDLADNHLYWLDAGVLTGDVLPALVTLDLARCRINDVDVGALTNLTRLQRIDMSGNRLDRLPPLGPGLTALTVADFNSNRLGGVLDGSPTLCGVPSLERLILSDNNIDRLNSRSFCPAVGHDCGAKLIELVLRKNRLFDVETGAWASLTAVERLDLSFNELTHLNASDLPWDSLTKLIVHDNHWDCSGCVNSWLVDEFSVKHSNIGSNVRYVLHL